MPPCPGFVKDGNGIRESISESPGRFGRSVFFIVGAYLCPQIFSLWFTDTYLNASDWKLFFGGLLFWNSMYLLRYGLFVLFTGIASALVTFPIRTAFALLALLFISLSALFPDVGVELTSYPSLTYGLMVIGLAGIFFEAPIVSWFRSRRRPLASVASSKADTEGAIGIVYMSGDDLSHLKLTADLLMDRWMVLRDKLNSRSLSLLH